MVVRTLRRAVAPLLYWPAYRAFRTRHFNQGGRIHRWTLRGFRLAAELGDRRALSFYGHLLFLRGDSTRSRIQGGLYLQQAADQGDPRALYQVGRIYEEGFEHYFRPDAERALSSYRQAAERGHLLAMQRMAEVCEGGELGMAVDPDQARHWRERMPG